MRKADVVVVGGSAAGLTAAITARRHYREKTVLIVRKEERVLIPCGIPYIFGTVDSPEKNLIPDSILEKNNVALLVDEAVEVNREAKAIHTAGGVEVLYDRLVLATGSLPVMPPIPGCDKANVYAVLKDLAHLRGMLESQKEARHLVVVGGGFIGTEFADECNKSRHLDVTIVEMLPHCLMLAYDEEFCAEAEQMLRDRGVRIVAGSKIARIEGNERVAAVLLDNGDKLEAEMIILAIGVRPNSELAEESGLRLGPTGAIAVDRTMKTTDDHIFACGDCAEKLSFFGGKPSLLRLASIATAEARIAGANLFGTRRESIGTIGVFSTAIGDTAFATAGLTESVARKHGYDTVAGRAEAPNRHPAGMPGMVNMKVKLVFERRTGLLLGGQVAGDKAAGELINAVSACIQRKMTAEDIAMFQTGTHPALTASPIAYQFVNAAEAAIAAMR